MDVSKGELCISLGEEPIVRSIESAKTDNLEYPRHHQHKYTKDGELQFPNH